MTAPPLHLLRRDRVVVRVRQAERMRAVEPKGSPRAPRATA
ncbi:hypothetical protein QFW77_13975 [Luteimonas sp. RD2P54]|uniref:Uncharacterized protein n=1 Tax=Luteimonas endophytica TaxID=3042023 RepID=A0ABT6JB75_9GAMM|nr:hypothetical protein [Luteimonas endophytica]MDH5824086.1 hypothetical protein [Luteimonas endophytica]